MLARWWPRDLPEGCGSMLLSPYETFIIKCDPSGQKCTITLFPNFKQYGTLPKSMPRLNFWKKYTNTCTVAWAREDEITNNLFSSNGHEWVNLGILRKNSQSEARQTAQFYKFSPQILRLARGRFLIEDGSFPYWAAFPEWRDKDFQPWGGGFSPEFLIAPYMSV